MSRGRARIAPPRHTTRYPRSWRVLARVLTVALAATLGAFAAAQGVTQVAALDYRDPALADLEQAILEAGSANAVLDGFGYALSARPGVELSGALGGEEDPSWSTSFAATATLSYRHSFVAPTRNERDLERARFNLAAAERDGILRALRAHVAWWTQTRALTTAHSRLEAAATALDDGELAFERGEIDGARLASLQLAFDRADLSLREAEHRHRSAVAEASLHGLAGSPSYEAIRFELPEPIVTTLFTVASLTATLHEAEMGARTTRLFRVPRDVRFSGAYGTEDLDLAVAVGVFRSVPGANVSIGYPGPRSPGWSVGVSAEFLIDDGTLEAIETAQGRVDDAHAALTSFLLTYPDDVSAARTTAGFAEENLTLAERALDLEERVVAGLEARLRDARQRLDAATGDEAAAIEREIASLERERDRAFTALDRAESALVSAWSTYVGQVHAYLRLTERGWAVK